MIERLTMRHLRTLHILHETKSMRSTAERVGRSQSAISLQIKDLEDIIGFRLIYHRRGMIVFTEEGKKFANYAYQLEAQLSNHIEKISRNTSTHIHFAVPHDIYDACRFEINTFRDYGIMLSAMTSREIQHNFSKEKIDVGIIKSNTRLLKASTSWTCNLTWAGDQDYNRHATKTKLVLLDSGCFYHHLALELFANVTPSSVDLVICNCWDDVANNLHDGGITIISSNWAKAIGSIERPETLPRLPHAVLNLMQSPNNDDPAIDWAVARLSRIVSTSISGRETILGPTWHKPNICAFSAQ